VISATGGKFPGGRRFESIPGGGGKSQDGSREEVVRRRKIGSSVLGRQGEVCGSQKIKSTKLEIKRREKTGRGDGRLRNLTRY